jgi:hypothetical protein
MARVVDNVAALFQKQPRRIVVLYFTPDYADLWDNIIFLKKVKATPSLCIYDTQQEAYPATPY